MSYNSGVIMLVISNQPRAMRSFDFKSLVRLLSELYSIAKHDQVKRSRTQTNKQYKGKSVQEDSFYFTLKLRKTVSILNFLI